MIDATSAQWRAIRKHIDARIETLRDQLERGGAVKSDDHLRGQIAELRNLVALAEPKRPGPTFEIKRDY